MDGWSDNLRPPVFSPISTPPIPAPIYETPHASHPTMKSCPSGHHLTRQNSYRNSGRTFCRTCRRLRQRSRMANLRSLKARATAAWLADLPDIILEADRLAGKPLPPPDTSELSDPPPDEC